MLKVGSIAFSFFYLVMEVPFKLTPNAIDKGLWIHKVLLEESFKLWPCDWSGTFIMTLVLGSFEFDDVTEEGSSKQSIIYLCEI